MIESSSTAPGANGTNDATSYPAATLTLASDDPVTRSTDLNAGCRSRRAATYPNEYRVRTLS